MYYIRIMSQYPLAHGVTKNGRDLDGEGPLGDFPKPSSAAEAEGPQAVKVEGSGAPARSTEHRAGRGLA